MARVFEYIKIVKTKDTGEFVGAFTNQRLAKLCAERRGDCEIVLVRVNDLTGWSMSYNDRNE